MSSCLSAQLSTGAPQPLYCLKILFEMEMLRRVGSCQNVMIISGHLQTMRKEAAMAYFKTLSRHSSGRSQKTTRTSLRAEQPRCDIQVANSCRSSFYVLICFKLTHSINKMTLNFIHMFFMMRFAWNNIQKRAHITSTFDMRLKLNFISLRGCRTF
jgi:hypothetical protein